MSKRCVTNSKRILAFLLLSVIFILSACGQEQTEQPTAANPTVTEVPQPLDTNEVIEDESSAKMNEANNAILGAWKGYNTSVVFKSDGTGTIENNEETYSFNWIWSEEYEQYFLFAGYVVNCKISERDGLLFIDTFLLGNNLAREEDYDAAVEAGIINLPEPASEAVPYPVYSEPYADPAPAPEELPYAEPAPLPAAPVAEPAAEPAQPIEPMQ